MEKINIAELLKDCPEGMELDCTIWDSEAKVFLKRVLNDDFAYPIEVTVKYNNTECTKSFTKYGAFNDLSYCKCVIFPKGKTTWDGFVPPFKFKDGDVLYIHSTSAWICIYNEGGEIANVYYKYVAMSSSTFTHDDAPLCCRDHVKEIRLATEEEKERLFRAIKDNGYQWNTETKTLEKLVEPKFKVGDRVKLNNSRFIYTITKLLEDRYRVTTDSNDLYEIAFERQDAYKLVPNKFDIATLKPFDKVFVRDNNTQKWVISFFSHCNGLEIYKYSCINGHRYAQCVPYEENKHLLGTTNDCDDFYKTWEK